MSLQAGRKACGLIVSSICLLSIWSSRPAAAADPSQREYLDRLVRTAEAEHAYDERPWKILLHYVSSHSLISDPHFFLSHAGRKDPAAELIATLQGMFDPNVSDNEQIQCRFPARSAWLKERLQIDPERLPAVKCSEFESIRKNISPKQAVLAFPAAFMNKPASMFGHTFIRIDNEYRSKLLGHAVNYAAFTGDSGGFLYAVKGLFGYFKGYYSVLPYYEKVKEYNDMEQRDIWEYELNFSEAELERMVMHIWELKDIYSQYYFLDENCSSNILFLFEAARPSLHLTDRLGWWVIPIDTVRLAREQGLVSDIIYRPSRATVIHHIASKLSRDLRRKARHMADGQISPEDALVDGISLEEQAEMLDLAAEAAQYFYAKKEMSKDDFQERFLHILTVRSKMGQESDETNDIPPPVAPDEGHGSYRLGISGGVKKGSAFQEIAFRPAYHTLTDPDAGYQKGSQIVFGDIAARYYPEKQRFRIESLDILNIISAAPRDIFFSPVSWRVSTGVKREYLRDGNDPAEFYASGGFGLAADSEAAGLAYVFGESEIDAGPGLRDHYALGAGGSLGLIRTVAGFWKVHLSGRAMAFVVGDRHETYKASIEQNFRISSHMSIIANVSRSRESGIYATEIRGGLNLFF